MTATVLAVGFWCSSSDRSWSWTPRPYLGAVAIILGLVATAVWWTTRGRHQDPLVQARAQADRAGLVAHAADGAAAPNAVPVPDVVDPHVGAKRTWAFALGAVGLWMCLDWPLAALGAGYLATAQLIRQVLMVMVVAPLLLFACPPELAARFVGWGKRLTVLRWTARPIVAVPVAAITLVVVNAPTVVDPLLSSPWGAFAMDAAWVTAGFILWMPVQCPHPGVRKLTGAGALVYLIGQSVVPVVPGFFMTWATTPIYRTYELAPPVFRGFDPIADQQTAAAVLQVGGMVLLWLQISYRFLKWGYTQMEADRVGRTKPIAGTPAPNP